MVAFRAPNTERALSFGSVRLRDGQTLILSGVIQDSERQQVGKLSLLGDLPLPGKLFRVSSTTRDKAEPIILVPGSGRSILGRCCPANLPGRKAG